MDKDLNKTQQSSDWSAGELSSNQIKYASNDVIFLVELKQMLESMLKREEVGSFLNNRSISLDQIKKLSHNSAIEDIILPILYPINANYIIEINDEVSKSLIKGKKVLINFLEENTNFQHINQGSLFLAIMNDIPIAICSLENCFLKPKRVFNL